MKPGAQVLYHPNGTYEAPVQVWDANKGVWLDKKNISTFFPPSWSQARIEYEVAEAFKAAVQAGRDPLKSFQFDSPSGIKIQFHWDAKNQRTTFYPLKP
ncbi:MAG: EndoU domain-containing protein [Pseudomonadota bacterium]